MAKPKNSKIHPAIRKVFGYEPSDSDEEVLEDLKHRTRDFCKPCWEIKYCPYGPIVENFPFLPSLKSGAIQQINELKKALAENQTGDIVPISASEQKFLKETLNSKKLLLELAHDIVIRNELEKYAQAKGVSLVEAYRHPPKFYYTHFYSDEPRPRLLSQVPKVYRAKVKKTMNALEISFRQKLKAGINDNRRALSSEQRREFEDRVRRFNADDYPDKIPSHIASTRCEVFGHICPVFFSAEQVSESGESRRRGRYISFTTRIRVTRRDNHTCQHCGRHLRDEEVEFDHVIPISRGGSSEEFNLRLTCFDCNRQKSDSMTFGKTN